MSKTIIRDSDTRKMFIHSTKRKNGFWKFWFNKWAVSHLFTLPFFFGIASAVNNIKDEKQAYNLVLYAAIGWPVLQLLVFAGAYFDWRRRRTTL